MKNLIDFFASDSRVRMTQVSIVAHWFGGGGYVFFVHYMLVLIIMMGDTSGIPYFISKHTTLAGNRN